MSDLIAWLRAQLDEDERVARAANPAPWRRITDQQPRLDPLTIFGGSYMGDENNLRNVASLEYSWVKDGNADHITRWDPARVLREVESKRALLDLHEPVPTGLRERPGPPQCGHCAQMCHSRSGLGCDSPDAPYPCPTVRLLAAPYADRLGYDPAWAVAG